MTEKLDLEKVRHIARLSRLELTNEEEGKFAEQLSSILDYVGQLREVETYNIESAANMTGLSNIAREDGVEESGITQGDIIKNAPEFKNGSFVVPGVFE